MLISEPEHRLNPIGYLSLLASAIMIITQANDGEVSALQLRCLTESDCSSSFHGANVLINGFLEIARPGKSNPRPERPLCVNTFI